MHILNVQKPTPQQIQTVLKEVNGTLEKLTQKLGILVNTETKKKRRDVRTKAIAKITSANQTVTKEEKEAIFINAGNLGFGEVEQRQVMTFSTAFRWLESAAQHSDVRDASDPFGNYVLSFYEHVVVMKEVSEQAMQSSLSLQKPKKATYTAEQWLLEKLASLYEAYFKADFGLAKPAAGGNSSFLQALLR